MKKLILIDGNNLVYRSYYATAYTGNIMRNSKGFPTNALYGFINMINKIITEENPDYIVVAFDKGKTFRHEFNKEYKATRSETPEELKQQFPLAKQLLTCMGIKYLETDNYEADDIIGTLTKLSNDNLKATIVSSDKDLLQLLNDNVNIKLLKQKDFVRYEYNDFIKEYGFEPIHIIDLKALMGDPSDNIKGVKGVGEKTALKLINEYRSINTLYEKIDEIKGKLKENLIENKQSALDSYYLATIYNDVKLDIQLDDIKYKELEDTNELIKLYEELEFYSFIKKTNKVIKTEEKTKIVKSIDEIKFDEINTIYVDITGNNYHMNKIIGLGIYNKFGTYYILEKDIDESLNKLNNYKFYTYDYKRLYVSLKYKGIELNNIEFDTMLGLYLLDYNIKEDISYVMSSFNNYVKDINETMKNNELIITLEELITNNHVKLKFIYDTYEEIVTKLKDNNLDRLYYEIDFPLSKILGNMEYEGIYVSKDILNDMSIEAKIKLEILSKEIYNHAGYEFNISSPSQVEQVLFHDLGLPTYKKTKTGFSTDIDVLNKLVNKHPIVSLIIEYRTISKLFNTYIMSLQKYIMEDGKIHTIYTQALTRTGRLSSIEPNLQNIPTRNDDGKLIRKAFLASENNVILSSDYSQIELRLFAHIAGIDSLIEAFNKGLDIHTKTAMDIFKVDVVSSYQRRIAKAVNFGIIYGISSYGLSENLGISPNEAKEFIDTYLVTYPGVKDYMNNTIKDAYDKGYVETLFNRRRVIQELSNSNNNIKKQGERIALNTPIQGTGADILKKAMININKVIIDNKLQAKMILQVHDELVFDCPIDEIKELSAIIIKEMENVYKLKVPLKVDINYGSNWYQVK